MGAGERKRERQIERESTEAISIDFHRSDEVENAHPNLENSRFKHTHFLGYVMAVTETNFISSH